MGSSHQRVTLRVALVMPLHRGVEPSCIWFPITLTWIVTGEPSWLPRVFFRLSCQVTLSRTFKSFQARSWKRSTPSHHKIGPNKRMLGEFLFHKLRAVRRLEGVIDEIKRSPENFSMRDFDYLWGRLQEFLVEDREDVNARSIELSLKSQKKSVSSKAGTPAVPAKAAPATPPAVAAAVETPAPPKADAKTVETRPTGRKIKGDRKAYDAGWEKPKPHAFFSSDALRSHSWCELLVWSHEGPTS